MLKEKVKFKGHTYTIIFDYGNGMIEICKGLPYNKVELVHQNEVEFIKC